MNNWNAIALQLFKINCQNLKGNILREKRSYKVFKIKKPLSKLKAFLINMAATYSPAFWCSTIGHEGLNFSVRNGKR